MEGFKEWFSRFSDFVKEEPVRASEEVRMLLVSITLLVGVTMDDVLLTSIMGVVTAVFSLWASKKSRDSVMPMKRVDSDFIAKEEVPYLDV